MDANVVIAIIERRRAKFQAQSNSSPRQDIDETAVVIVGEYDALLAEIDQALALQPDADGKTKKLRPRSLESRDNPADEKRKGLNVKEKRSRRNAR